MNEPIIEFYDEWTRQWVRVPKSTMYDTTLNWVNNCRRFLGLPELSDLKKGVRGDSKSCVLANSLHWGFYESFCSDTKPPGIYDYDIPTEISHFIHAFDRGQFPELIIG